MPDKVPECLLDRMPEDLPDRMPDRMSEDIPEHIAEDMPGRMPEDMPEDMPDRMPEDMDKMPEDMSDRMPEDVPVTKRINVMVGIIVFLGYISNLVNTRFRNRSFFEENHKKWKITKSTERKKAHNYANSAFGSESTVQTQLHKKSVRVQERSKSVQKLLKTVRNNVTFYVKRRDFQDLKRHDFVFVQGKAVQGVEKAFRSITGRKKAFGLEKTVPEQFFSSKWSKIKSFENGLEKPI